MSLLAPRQLQQLEVPLISRETCRCLYNIGAKPEEPHSIQQDMVCAGYVKGGKDACQVNAGGLEDKCLLAAEGRRGWWGRPEALGLRPDSHLFLFRETLGAHSPALWGASGTWQAS